MRAAVFHGPGDIRIEDVAEPAAPGHGELLIGVTRAAICGTDASEWVHGPLLATPPVVLGHEFVGEVIAADDDTGDLGVGDRVVCGAGISCGHCDWCLGGRTNLCATYRTIGLHVDGGLAEQVLAPASICRRVPEGVGDDAAAMAQPLAVALHAVRRSEVGEGEDCVVVGCGGIGAFCVAGAVARGARVIALDVDTERLATAQRLGAAVTVDVDGLDLAAVIREQTGGLGAHVVLEASGAPHAPAGALAGARKGGRVVLVGLQSAPRELDLLAFAVREVDLATTLAHVCAVDLPEALELLATADIADVVLDRVISLERLVEDGILPLAERTARGKIVVNPTPALVPTPAGAATRDAA
jgi:(R,R)-butanediol dehydrogenase / meso-butanediol dehydrogenase / diacetyl reductase